METNHTVFIRAYNTLQETIEERTGKRFKNFGKAFYHAINSNDHLVKRHKAKIEFYMELRNLLSHEATLKQPPFAEPSDYLITDILKTIQDIKNPNKVRDVFLSDVKTFQVDDMLTEVLDVIQKENYSQFPVFEQNKLIGLITENGITSFLAQSVEEDIISIKETTIADIVSATKDEAIDAYVIVNTNENIYEIENIFIENTKKGNARFTILISHLANKIGKPQDIAGIITPWDMPKVSEHSNGKLEIE